MNLDDELRRMFADVEERLDVPVRPDAGETIVAGARRRRKRRAAVAAASGVLAVAVMVGGGILATFPDRESTPPAMTSPSPEPSASAGSSASSRPSAPSSAGEATPPRTAPTGGEDDPGGGGGPNDPEPSREPAQPAVTGALIGPDGFGPMRLGMTYEELLATGAIQEGTPPGESGCAAYEFTVQGVSGYVHVSAAGGAQAILTGMASLHTADGVSTEWTRAQVQTVYPEVTQQAIVDQNPIPVATGTGNAVYLLAFIGDGLSEISLRYADQTCV